MVNLAIFAIGAALAAPPSLTLSQKDVAELVLRQGRPAKEVQYTYEQYLFNKLDAEKVLDWNLTIEAGKAMDRQQSLGAPTNDAKVDQLRSSVSVSKSFITGTTLQFDVNRTSQKTTALTTLPDLVQDTYLLSLTQNLWRNSFGYGTRATVNGADLTYKSTVILRANELETAVLNGVRKFWDTYVAQENFRSALAARDRYEKLVAAARRKTSVGYANPGELSQAQAELEQKTQTVKNTSVNYLLSLEQLLTMLNLDPNTEVTFSVPKELPPVPRLETRSIEDLRSVRSQSFRAKAAAENLSLAQSNEKPDVSLIARLGAAGVEDNAERSYSELTSGTYNQTFVGVRFSYAFGSGVLSESVHAKKAALALEEAKLDRVRAEERDNAVAAERRVGSTYAVAQSAARERDFRDKAVQELTRTYNQGRTEIRNLIDALNNQFTAEVAVISALGQYHIALNEWAAARDELIPDEKAKQESP